VLPNATLRELPGENHNVSASAIVPVLAEVVAVKAPCHDPAGYLVSRA